MPQLMNFLNDVLHFQTDNITKNRSAMRQSNSLSPNTLFYLEKSASCDLAPSKPVKWLKLYFHLSAGATGQSHFHLSE